MGYSDDEWRSVVRLLVDHGFIVVTEDKEAGLVTVRVPE